MEEAFVYQKAIEAEICKEMRAKLTKELTLAEMELRDAQAEAIEAEAIEIEAVLDFAQMVLERIEPLESRVSGAEQRLQQILFPEGVTYSGGIIEPV